ncbi:transcription termination factor Rho [Halalkalibacter hemicellulosilyticusJCM 9152]|uniref:Transcription termination factor Rho n=2 Tax=Halalkalibacter TaxID=2893056 RepID=W4QH76_9BACI|nr:transcription termination factor Rho [Halalkalibacter hemicellulosilyticusJCM 9152]
MPKSQLDKLWAIRKTMNDSPDFVDHFIKRVKETKTNIDFFASMEEEMNARGRKR